jgi:hypothetical protein
MDRVLQISAPLNEKTTSHENFLIWAAPGSGKSFFVEEVQRTFGGQIEYIELNFAKHTDSQIANKIVQIKQSSSQLLVLLDEIDALPVYNDIFPLLDINAEEAQRRAVFVAVGSFGQGLESMIRAIATRPKGPDLLSRIPAGSRFEIPQPGIEDQIIVFATQARLAAGLRRAAVREIERLALYYIAKERKFHGARAIRDLAHAAVARMEKGETRLRYDHLFERSSRESQEFWTRNVHSVQVLTGHFLALE